MKKIVSFEKEILFPTMIGEITSISLDNYLSFTSKCSIEGKFIIKGSYKMTEASNLEEEFSYDIPVDISLMENLELDTASIKVDDFIYSISNDEYLKCNIDVLIEGVEEVIIEEDVPEVEVLNEKIIDEEVVDDVREVIDNSEKEKVVEDVRTVIENNDKKEIIEEVINTDLTLTEEDRECDGEMEKEEIVLDEENKQNISSIFSILSNSEETYKEYSVYIVQGNETIDDIMGKYKVSREDLEMYNDLNNFSKGIKLIIPSTNE